MDKVSFLSFGFYSQVIQKNVHLWVYQVIQLSSKRPVFERIRDFRKNAWCWDQHFFQYFSFNLEARFLKMSQNLLKSVLACSVPLSKRLGFDRIRNFRGNAWCWDNISSNIISQIYRRSILGNGSKPLESCFSVLCAFQQTAGFWQN